MSRFRKVESRTWSDEKFRQLSPIPPCGQGLWLFLMTGPHTGPIPGLFRAGRAGMSEELEWDVEAFDEAFAEVSQQGMAKADFKARLVWLPNAIKYNKPESPNVIRSWRTELDLLPECDLKRQALEGIRQALADIGPSYMEAFDEIVSPASKPLPKPSRKPSGKALPEGYGESGAGAGAGAGEKEATASVGDDADAPGLPRCQAQAVVGLYHEVLPEMPTAKLMTDARGKAIRKFWRWVLTSKKSDGTPRAQTADQALTWIRAYFERARDNDFLMGRTKPRAGHENWRCDIDFLLTERGMKHVIEKTAEAA